MKRSAMLPSASAEDAELIASLNHRLIEVTDDRDELLRALECITDALGMSSGIELTKIIARIEELDARDLAQAGALTLLSAELDAAYLAGAALAAERVRLLCDRDAHAARCVELARRVTELEQELTTYSRGGR
jgi:hypothetical protein